jgi:hypothetical protein
MNGRRPGKRRDLLFRDRALTVAIAVAAIAATLLVIRAASGQPPPSLRALVEDRHQGRTAEWWARRTTVWKRRAQRRDLRIHRLRAANRQRVELGAHGVARGLLCIHSFEGSWTDPAAPHWGGLQMDLDFQRSYGGPFLAALGTADRWPVFVQVAVAMEAYYSGRGYGPWPNTRRRCGL